MIHGLIVGAALPVTLAVSLAGCRRSELAAGVTDSSYVGAMAELRHIARDASLDSARRASARAAVLQRRGLTAEQLESAARALADDPKRAQALFQQIEMRANAPVEKAR